jgi:UDP-3-O-[3-hydroxymyristoyl] glucosamine N-acyltransferase
MFCSKTDFSKQSCESNNIQADNYILIQDFTTFAFAQKFKMRLGRKLSVKEIAATYGAKIIGDENAEIGSIREIHKLDSDSITFVDHEKYYEKVLSSVARVVIINKEVECPEGKTLLVTENPFELYNNLALQTRPFEMQHEMIAPTASIGSNTLIMPNVFVGHHVKIGKNCIIHPGVCIYAYSEIGDNVIIHANTVIGSDAYYYHRGSGGYDKMHTIGRAIIEDDVEIGSSCSIDSGVSGDTIIGKGTKVDNQVHLGHGAVVGQNCLLAAQVAIAGKTHIGNNCILYGKVGISKGLVIGDNAVILAASNVSKSLPGNETYFGSPANKAKDVWREMAHVRMLSNMWKQLVFKKEGE